MNTGKQINVMESGINHEFIQNFLDTVPGNSIVLDQNGKIVCHDNNWITFAENFGFSKLKNYRGAYYFEIVFSVTCISKGVEKDIFDEIENLLQDKSKHFEGEYITKIDKKNFRISLVGKKFSYAGNNWVTLTYLDITDKKEDYPEDLVEPDDFHLIFDQVGVGMAKVSLNGVFLNANKKFCEIMGYSYNEIRQLNFKDISYSEDSDLYVKEVEQMIIGRKNSISGEKRYRRKNGEIILGRITISLIKKKSGEPKYLHAVFEDITDRLKIEAALYKSRINYENLVEQAQDGIALLQNDKIKFVNSAMAKHTGWSMKELINKPFISFIADNELLKVVEIHRKRLNGEKVSDIYETVVKKKNGDTLEVEFNSRLTEVDGTQIVMIRDISERKKKARTQKLILEELQQERNMFVSGPVVIFKWSNEEGYPTEYVSPNVFEVFGYTPEELTSGKISYGKLISELDIERVNKQDDIQKKLKNNNHYTQEPYRIIRKNGEIIWVLDHTTVIRDKKGTIVNYLGYVVDITEQKRMEDALRKSEFKYRTLFDNIPQKVFLKDKDSVYISCNQNYADDLGIRASEIEGKRDCDFFPEKFTNKFRADDKRVMKNGKTEVLDEEYLHFGQDIMNRVIKTPVKNNEGEITGILGIFWDITEQHKTEELLRESEEKFRVLITNLEEVIYILDKDGIIELSEGKGLLKVGSIPGETVGSSVFELYKNHPYVLHQLRKTLKGENVQFESKLGENYYRNWCTPRKNRKGDIIGLLGLSVDITKQKKIEKELIKSKARFHDVVMNLQEGFYSTSLEGKIMFYNREYIDVLGLDPNINYIGETLQDFWQNPEDRGAYIEDILKDGFLRNYLVYAKKANGENITLRANSVLVVDEEENSIRIDGVFQDVTTQIKDKESLKMSEERLSSFIESATDGFALFDSNFNLLRYNGVTLDIFPPHISKNIRVGINIKKIAPYLMETDRYEQYLEVIKSGRSIFFEDVVFEKKYSDQAINIKAFKVGDGIGMIFQDITENKRARLKLKESEKKYRDLIEQSKDGVALIQDGIIVFTNSVITDMLGYSKDKFKKMSFVDLAHPDELPRLLDYYKRRMNNEELPSIYETRLIKKDGTTLHVEFNVAKTTYLNEDAVLIMARDISDRKTAEGKIIKYQKRLKALASELIVTEEKQRKQIATDLHDNVGQLLASSRLQMAAINERMEKEVILLKIESVSQGMLQAIQSIRNAIFNLSPPQLNEIGLFAATSDWLEDQIELKHGINTIIRGEDRFFPMKENTRFLIFRSIRELLINIVKHANAKNIIVTLKANNKNIYIDIEDDGIGFDYHPELFGFKSKSIGLFSVHERITDIGGSMVIDSSLGQGTKVSLVIPLTD